MQSLTDAGRHWENRGKRTGISIGVGGFNAVSSTDKLRAHFPPEKPGAHGAMKYISGY